MDERIDLKKQGKLKTNITRFRQDKRLAVTGILYSLALIGMLAIVVFGIFHYQEELNPENFSRLMSYLKAAGSVSDPFTEYRFEAGLDTTYAPFGAGLAVSSGDTYSFISGLGDSRYSIQLHYAHPSLCASDKYVLIYDRGSGGFCVANSYAEYLRDSLDSPILNASMNREGAFALITDEEGSRSAVSVFSPKQKLLCQWKTAHDYLMFCSVSPECDSFSVLGLSQEEMTLRSRVQQFRIGEEEAAWTVDLGDRQVYSMTHDKSGGLVILCDDGVYRYDSAGACTASYPFTLPLRLFSAQESGPMLLCFELVRNGARYTSAVILGDELSVLWRGELTGLPRAIDCRGGTAALLMTDRLELVRYAEETPAMHRLHHDGARDVVVDGDGSPILIYSDSARKVLPESEELK